MKRRNRNGYKGITKRVTPPPPAAKSKRARKPVAGSLTRRERDVLRRILAGDRFINVFGEWRLVRTVNGHDVTTKVRQAIGDALRAMRYVVSIGASWWRFTLHFNGAKALGVL